jgi:hypothetical protein
MCERAFGGIDPNHNFCKCPQTHIYKSATNVRFEWRALCIFEPYGKRQTFTKKWGVAPKTVVVDP